MPLITAIRPLGWAARLLLLAVLGVTAGCSDGGHVLEGIKQEGKLVVLTRNGPTTYYEGPHGPDGFEYQLTQELGRSLGVEVEYRLYDSIDELLEALEGGQGHLAAAGLTRTEEREQRYRFGPDYKHVQQQVVCHGRSQMPDGPQDLVDVPVTVLAGSSYEETLQQLQQELPALQWRAQADISTDQILERIWRSREGCTVADSNIASVHLHFYPGLRVAFPISEAQQLAWVLPDHAGGLEDYLEDWLEEAEAKGVMAQINERFYGYVELYDYVDLRAFVRRIDRRLPKYAPLFQTAGKRHDIEWTLLAAQSYQESHWNPKAKSPTGVRGMMMLALPTAKELGVSNRLDAKQSIFGGAKYLRKLIKRLPEQIEQQDRLWFALAAYNIGMGHVRDALTLAEEELEFPYQWHEFQTVLPLLTQKQYYKKLRYGYARGNEPVRYVQRVRQYHDVLLNHLEPSPGRSAAHAVSGS